MPQAPGRDYRGIIDNGFSGREDRLRDHYAACGFRSVVPGGDAGWVRTSGYAAWVPLAPREIYYGYGDCGRNSVNITNGITVVRRTTFVTGRPAPVQRDVEEPTCRR